MLKCLNLTLEEFNLTLKNLEQSKRAIYLKLVGSSVKLMIFKDFVANLFWHYNIVIKVICFIILKSIRKMEIKVLVKSK